MKPARQAWLTAALFIGLATAGGAVALYELRSPLGYIGAALACWLALASFIDARHFLLLDILTLPLALAGLALAYAGYGPTLLNAGLGAAIGYLGLWALSALYYRVRGQDGLGMGDAKLICAAGAWCGALALPSVLLIGSISALIYAALVALSGRQVGAGFKLPFGPFLSVGFFVTWVLLKTGSQWVPS